MRTKTFSIIFFYLFFSFVFTQTSFYEYPPHQKVYENNLDLVSKGPFIRQKPPWLNFQQPSLSNPFHYAFFKFTSFYPSVSNRTSANKLQSVFWIWGEDHPDYYIIYLTPDACGQSYRSFRVFRNSTLSGILKVSLDQTSKTYVLKNDSYDPFPIQFSSEELSLLKTKSNAKEAVLPLLNLEFNGTINITYKVFEMDYIMEITKEGIKCRAVSRTYLKIFSHPVSDKMILDVEHSSPSFYLLQPIDNEQLSFSPQSKFVFLTNAYANKIWIISQNFIASNRFANYSIKKDSFSFENIIREDFPLPIKEQNLVSNSSLKFLNSSFFIDKDYNFAHQYYSHSFLPHSLGKRSFSFYFLDDFNQISSFNKELIFRSAQGIRNFLSNYSIFQTDQNAEASTLRFLNNTLILSLSEKNRASFYTFFDSIKIILSNGHLIMSIFILGIILITLWLKD